MSDRQSGTLPQAVYLPDGRCVLRAGVLCTFFIERTSTAEQKLAVLACLDEFMAQWGAQIRWTTDPVQHRWRDARKERVATREWLPHVDPNEQWDLVFHDGERREDAASTAFYALSAPEWDPVQATFLQLRTPTPRSAPEWDELRSLVCGWAERLRPVCGSAGLGLQYPFDSSVIQQLQPTIYALAQRYPGLEVSEPINQSLSIGLSNWHTRSGFLNVNWLTMLDERWLPLVGGVEHLRAQLEPECPVYAYPRGVVIQAGEQPVAGDVNAGVFPEAYRKVYRAVRAAQLEGPGPKAVFQCFSFTGIPDDGNERWLRRFE